MTESKKEKVWGQKSKYYNKETELFECPYCDYVSPKALGGHITFKHKKEREAEAKEKESKNKKNIGKQSKEIKKKLKERPNPSEVDNIDYDEFNTVKDKKKSKYYSERLDMFVCPYCTFNSPWIDHQFYAHVRECRQKENDSKYMIFNFLKEAPIELIEAFDSDKLKALIISKRQEDKKL